MTTNIYKSPNYNTDHSTFGGKIYLSDFNTEYREQGNTKGSAIARRIAADQSFDRQCQANIKNKKF